MYEDKILRCKDCGKTAASLVRMQSGLIVRCTLLCAQIVAAKQRSHLSRWKARITIAANALRSAKRPKKRQMLMNKVKLLTAFL